MANKNPVVVCVDDDEAMLSTVVRCLKREPFEIRSTLSATEALSWVAYGVVRVAMGMLRYGGDEWWRGHDPARR